MTSPKPIENKFKVVPERDSKLASEEFDEKDIIIDSLRREIEALREGIETYYAHTSDKRWATKNADKIRAERGEG